MRRVRGTARYDAQRSGHAAARFCSLSFWSLITEPAVGLTRLLDGLCARTFVGLSIPTD